MPFTLTPLVSPRSHQKMQWIRQFFPQNTPPVSKRASICGKILKALARHGQNVNLCPSKVILRFTIFAR